MSNKPLSKNPIFQKNNRLQLNQLEQRVLYDAELVFDLVDASKDTTSIDSKVLDNGEQSIDFNLELNALAENLSDTTNTSEKIVFIDSNVLNKQAFIDVAQNYSTVILLSGYKNPWEQISESVSQYSNIKEIHLISHGDENGIILNSKTYNLDNLSEYSVYLDSIKSHVQEGGDFLIYGCNVGSNEKVNEFSQALKEHTGLDIALSENDTGGTANADYKFEFEKGTIEAKAIIPLVYDSKLAGTSDGFGDADYNGDGTADPLRMITWNVIGLDSNKPETSGPDTFMLGLRVNTDNQAMTNYTVKLVDDDGKDIFGTGIIFADSTTPTGDFDDGVDNIQFINKTVYTGVNIEANSYKDFYFNVSVERLLSSLGQMQAFHFEVFQDDNQDGVFDPTESGQKLTKFSWLPDAAAANTPLYLYVEKLISQARNDVTNQTYPTQDTSDNTYAAIRVDGYTVNGMYPDPAAPLTLFVGQELNIRTEAETSTQGYPQLTVSTLFNTGVFQINSVAEGYSSTSTVNTYQQSLGDGVEADGNLETLDGVNDNTSVYANSAGWNPATHSLMITSAPPKAGGNIVADYNVTITGTGSGKLDTLIQDYSGSSFHYNADLDNGVQGIDYVKYIAVKGSIVGQVLADTDSDGVGDSPLAGVTITLNGTLDPNMNGQIDVGENSTITQITVTTDENGYYVFTDLLPGVYTVVEGSIPGYGDVTDTDGGNKNQVTVVIGKNVNIGTAASLGLSGVLAYRSSSSSEVLTGDQMLGYQRADFVEGQPDLSLTKSASTLNPAPGGQVTFTLTVTNDGSATAPYVEVMDKLPTGLNYVSSSGDGTYDSDMGLWIIDGGVEKGQTKTIEIVCTLVSNEAVSNFAQIVSIKDAPSGNDIQDADSTVNNNLGTDGIRGTEDDGSRTPFEDDEAKVTVQAKESDLSLVKTYSNFSDAGDRPALGDILEFKIIVVNSGPDDATNISIQDRLPSELGSITVVSASTGTFDTNTGIWDITSLANGETATLIYRGTLVGVSQFSNFAHIISSDQYDPDSTPDNDTNSSANEDDEAKVVLTPHASDLSLSKIASNISPDIGSNVTFTLILTNKGPDAATNVTVKDYLPPELTWVSGGSFSNDIVTWSAGDLAVGETKTLQIVATVTVSTPITNYAQITSSDTPDPDSTVDNDVDNSADEDDEAKITITPGATDLSLSKSYVVDDGVMSSLNEPITFTLKVTNSGTKDAYNVRVVDQLATGLSFVSSAYGGVGYQGTGTYNNVTGVWDIGTVAAGETVTISFKATVTTLLEKTNYAEIVEADASPTDTAGDGTSTLYDIDSTFNNDSGNKTANEDDEAKITIAKIPYADLQLTNVISKVNPTENENITFTLTVTNTGYADTTGVQVAYVFPQNTGASSQFADPSSFVFSDITDTNTYSSTSGAGTWTIGSLSYGETATLTITVKTPTGSGGDRFTSDLSLFAQISASSLPDTDSTVANNKGTDTLLATADDGTRTPYEDDEAIATAISPTSTRLDVALTETISVTRAAMPISNADPLEEGDEVTVKVIAYNQGGDANSAYFIVKWDPNLDLGSATLASSTATQQCVIDYSTDANGTTFVGTLPSNPTYIRVKIDTSSSASKFDSGSNVTLTLVGNVNASGVGQNATVSAWFADIGSGSDVDADSSVKGVVTGSDSNDLSTDDLTDTIKDDDEAVVVIGGNQSSDLSITKSISVDGAQTFYNTVSMYDGDTATLRINITNSGPDVATNVTVNNTLPTGLVYRTSYGYGSYDTGTNTWNIGTLNVGQTVSIYVLVDVDWDATVSSSLQSVSEVKTVDQPDIDSTKNNGVITEDDYAFITINKDIFEKADLSLTKTVSNAAPEFGDLITFTITVSNAGPATATGVVVKDYLPDGLIYVSDNGLGSYDPNTGLFTIASITSGSSVSLQIVAQVNTVTPIANFAQITASDLPDPDSTVNNDSDNTDNEDDEAKAVINPKSSDLSLTKVVDNPTPNVGDTIKFTLTVLNSGYTDATGVQVKDLIDPTILENISVFSSTGDSNYDPITGIWNIGNVAVGEVVKIEISGTLISASSFYNFAQIIASDLSDPDSTANNDTDNLADEDDEGSVLVTPRANDLEIYKSFKNLNDPSGHLDVNDTVQFTITLINAGGVDATNVQIQDYLPSDLYLDNIQLLSSKINGLNAGNFNTATGIWDLSSETISSGSIAVLTYTAIVKNADSFDVFAEIVSANEYDVDSTPGNDGLVATTDEDDEAKVTLDARSADLSLIKSVSKSHPQIGESITFSIDVINSSADDATGVSIVDYLSDDFAFVTGSANLSGVYADNPLGTDTLTWNNLTIAGYSKVTLTFRAIALFGTVAVNNAEITNTDVYDPDSSPNDSFGDDYASVEVDAQSADLSLIKTVNVSTPEQAKIDGYYTATYTIQVRNDGPDGTSFVEVKDGLAKGLVYLSSTATSGSYNPNSGIWQIDSLASGAVQELTIVTKVLWANDIENKAEITSSSVKDPDSNPNNNSGSEDDESSATINVEMVDLSLTKSVSTDYPQIGDPISYQLILKNGINFDAATGVKITDQLPSGFAFTDYVADKGTFNELTGVWDVGTVNPGEVITLTINGIVASLSGLSNVAEITAVDQLDVDSTPNDGVDGQDDYAKASPSSISLITGKVFDDMFGAKANEFDVLDKPIANVTIQLFYAGADPLTATPIATTTTDINGVYNFYVPSGSYLIYQVDPNNLLSVASLQSVDPNSGDATLDTTDPGFNTKTLNVIAASEYYENNFLDLTPLKISGNVFYDADKDGAGLGDADDLGLASAQVGLFKANSSGTDGIWGTADDVYTQIGSYITVNNDGSYSFESLSPGRYKIVEVNPFGYSDIEDTDGSTNGDSQVEVVLSGATGDISNVNFLDNIEPGTIIGKVTFDADEDSAAFGDADDTVLSGVTVKLFAEGDDPLTATPIATATTDVDGNFSFTGILPGNYIVYQVNEADKDSVNDTDGANDDQIAVTLTIGESVKDIGFVDKIKPDSPPTVNITDNNGVNSGQEVVIENATLTDKTFSLTTANTIAKITVGGQDITNAELLAASTTPIIITTTKGVLTITNYDDTTHVVTYSYDPTGDYQDHSLGEITDDIVIGITDGNDLTGSATLTILITDTEPLGVNDTDSINEDASPETVSGSVFVNNGEDLTGADSPIKVIGVVSGAEVLPLNDNTTVASEITGTYGKVVINEDGSYTYTLDNTNSLVQSLDDTETLEDVFTYTIVDTDGSTSIATLTITINGATDSISVTVTDNNGLDDGDETVAENETLTDKTFSFSSTDPIDKITIAGFDVIYAELLDAATNNITITTTEGVLTITGFNSATNTITYSYDPSGTNKDHSSGSVKDAISITVTDVYGRTDNTTLTILITDTAPTAFNDENSINEDDTSNEVSSSVFSGAGADLTGEDTPIGVVGVEAGVQDAAIQNAATVGAEITGTYGKVIINQDGSYTYTLDNTNGTVQALNVGDTLTDTFTYSIVDTDGSTSFAKLTITINGINEPFLDIIVPDNNGVILGHETVVENSSLTDKYFSINSSSDIAKITIAGTDIIYADLVDSGTTPISINSTEGVITITGFNEATKDVTYSYDPSGSNKDHSNGKVKDIISIVVTDINNFTGNAPLVILITDTQPLAVNDSNSITEDGASNTVSSSVFIGAGEDTTGSDNPIILTGVASGNTGSYLNSNSTVGNTVSGNYGQVVINQDGSYTYTLDNTNPTVQGLNNGDILTETFTYSIVDSDGSTSFATLTITINGANEPYADLVTIKELYSENKNYGKGDIVSFLIKVENTGDTNTTGVSLTENIPNGLSLVSATTSNGSFVGNVWNIGNLNVGQVATLILNFEVTVDQDTAIVNTVSAATSDLNDPSNSGNDLEETINVKQIIISPEEPKYVAIPDSRVEPDPQTKPPTNQNIYFDPSLHVTNAVKEVSDEAFGISFERERELTSSTTLNNWDPALYVLPAVQNVVQEVAVLSGRISDYNSNLTSQIGFENNYSPLRSGLIKAMDNENSSLREKETSINNTQEELRNIEINSDEKPKENKDLLGNVDLEEDFNRKVGNFNQQLNNLRDLA